MSAVAVFSAMVKPRLTGLIAGKDAYITLVWTIRLRNTDIKQKGHNISGYLRP